MTFSFDERRRDSALAVLQWEKKRLSFKIHVPNVNQLYVDAMRRELMAWPGFNPENWDTAAQFCADNKINLDEALVWANKAIDSPFRGAVPGRRDFLTLSTKAAVLRAMQRNAEADSLMEEAIHLPGTDAFQIHSYGTSLLAAGKNDKAMGVFKFNRDRYPDQFVTWIGLARGYTALGDKQNAIKTWELAIHHVPENFKSLIPRMEKALKKLQEGG
jgi:tetratricopeptide (TPR) repeat protein